MPDDKKSDWTKVAVVGRRFAWCGPLRLAYTFTLPRSVFGGPLLPRKFYGEGAEEGL